MKLPSLPVLTAIFAIGHLDRHVLSISLDKIGLEFDLSDLQLGLLSGLIFAIVFVLFGFPVARLAARGNRRNIVAVSAFVWSAMTLVMGTAQNFTHLILARLGVGIGEAGAVAPAHSMISDLYPPGKRTSAMATFSIGANIGVLLAFLIGGIIGQLLGWRWAFFIAGVPGILLAFVLRYGTDEPKRVEASSGSDDGSLFLATLKAIRSDRGLVHAICGVGLTGIVTFGALTWNPSFLIRVHGLSQAQAGIVLAVAIGLFGSMGTWLSGRLADRLGATDARWRIWLVVIAIVIGKVFSFGFLLIDHRFAAIGFLLGSATLAGVFWGPTFAYLHAKVPTEMRPMATAMFLFAFNLVGLGIGPTLIGFLSDQVFAGQGTASLRYALATIQFISFWGAWHYWKVSRTMTAGQPTAEPA